MAACVVTCGAAAAEGPPGRSVEGKQPRHTVDLHVHSDPLRLAMGGAFVGGVAGLTVGAGVLGVLSATGHAPQDWVPVLATTAGVGVAIGLVWGVMEARAAPPPAVASRPAKDGLAFTDQHRAELSGTVLLPVFGRKF